MNIDEHVWQAGDEAIIHAPDDEFGLGTLHGKVVEIAHAYPDGYYRIRENRTGYTDYAQLADLRPVPPVEPKPDDDPKPGEVWQYERSAVSGGLARIESIEDAPVPYAATITGPAWNPDLGRSGLFYRRELVSKVYDPREPEAVPNTAPISLGYQQHVKRVLDSPAEPDPIAALRRIRDDLDAAIRRAEKRAEGGGA